MGQVVTIGLEFIPFFFLIFLSPLIFLLLEYHLPFLSWSNATLSLTLYYYNHVLTLITQSTLHTPSLKHFHKLLQLLFVWFVAFTLQVSEWKLLSHVWLFMTPWTIVSPWSSSGQNIGVGSLSLLQGIFPTQEPNPGLLHFRWILYQLSQQGSPKVKVLVAKSYLSMEFSRQEYWSG